MGICDAFCSCSSPNERQVSPDDIYETQSRGSATPSQILNVNDRSCTDTFFLILKACFVVVLIVLVAYCMSFGDIYRLINGYDDCANVCGMDNKPDNQLGCKGVDRRNQKYLKIDASELDGSQSVHRTCVTRCEEFPGFQTFLNRCLKITQPQGDSTTNTFFSKTGFSNFFLEVSEDLHMCWQEIMLMCCIAFCFSIIILVLFRYVVGFVVWLVLVGAVIACVIGTIFLWIQYANVSSKEYQNELSKRKVSSYLVFAILATIITVCVCLVIFVMRKRIRLVIQLFKEAGKAISSMPLLLAEPVLTFVALSITIVLWFYFTLWIESSGTLIVGNNQSAKYVKDTTMKVTRWYNFLALLWFSQFIMGCQHMVIAGSVAIWFFTRNKSKLDQPIWTSFKNLVRYHLGTVAFGSFLIALVQFVRYGLKAWQMAFNNPQNRLTTFLYNGCQCCLVCLEKFLQYLTRNSYIETAMFGMPFISAGKNAYGILSANALRVFAINSVGDFVLLLGKVLVVMATVLVGMELIQKKDGIHYTWVPLLMAGLFAYLISHCFLTVYEMTIDTIFLCFCEDCERNDGITRPYYMSRGLMEFVQNSKKALNVADKESGRAWTKSAKSSVGNGKAVEKISDTVD